MQKAVVLGLVFMVSLVAIAVSQPITGVWRGRVIKGSPPLTTAYKVEVKIIRQGDSLTGTSYYYANKTNYFRYAIKGYLDDADGSLHWWDDTLLEQKGNSTAWAPFYQQPLQLQADFNCPGSGIMQLDGLANNNNETEWQLHLTKFDDPLFADGWDDLMANWLYGGAHPDAIAEAEQQQRTTNPMQTPAPKPVPGPTTATGSTAKVPSPQPPSPSPKPATSIETPTTTTAPPVVLTTRQKFDTRQRQVQTIIPVAGDSIELQFFDNAEIDGDSIALFLNDVLIMEHIKLSAQPFIIKLAIADLPPNAELSMVAENLGAIPPNTSFMMAYVNGQRYTARLESTEGTTAVIKFQQ